MSHSQIRGSFIRQYADRHREYQRRSWELIGARDDEHRALNRAHGFVDPDGTVPIGCRSQVDLEYKRKYDEIEARFCVPYDRGLPDLRAWCGRESMSVYEFMFIDNIYDEHLQAIADESIDRPDWQMDFIARKAGLFIQRLKAAHRVGQIRRLIDMEMDHHRYALARCRKELAIKPWDVGRQIKLQEYRRAWKAALEHVFASMVAG